MRRAGRLVVTEAEAVGFKWEPTLVVACAALALLLQQYQGKSNGVFSALRWMGGAEFAESCNRLGFNYALLLQVGLPLLAILAMRRSPKDFGLGLGNVRRGLTLCLVFYALYIPCFILLFSNSGFQEYYAGVARRYTTWPQFLSQEAISVALLSLRTEFLFRGFLLFGIKREYGPYAGILVQLVPYVLVHSGKAEIEAIGSLPVGLALAYLALRTNSIWYGAVLHGSIAVLFNALILLRHFLRA